MIERSTLTKIIVLVVMFGVVEDLVLLTWVGRR